jgi:D-alanyl-lipoteichoic acid acyltransferase DltB (MBOAT superfamily)
MEITSITFLLFIAVSLLVYWVMPKGWQWLVLLADSLIFYFLNAEWYTFVYLLISVATVWAATNYFLNCSDEKLKKAVLVCTIIINIGMLTVLKYTNLAIGTINTVNSMVGGEQFKAVSWAASLGISFYTLQIVSYLLDAYWGVTDTERNPVKLLLYTSFFPIMISGPINRHKDLGHQLFEEHRFDYTSVTHGMKRLAWGLLKVYAVSGKLAMVVTMLWRNVDVCDGLWIWLTAFLYAIELYAEFSGSMDIVIGASECFGIKLAENFNAPFFSKTVQEFWQRWHITLGTWLRDYILNPLLKSRALISLGEKCRAKFGKKQGKKIPAYIAMLAVWLSMGLWHGSSWKYIVGEGLWFWLVIVLGQVLEPLSVKIKNVLHVKGGWLWKTWQIIRTNLIFMVGMLFFRAGSLPEAVDMLGKSIGLGHSISVVKPVLTSYMASKGMGVGATWVLLLAISLVMMFVYDAFLYRGVNLIDRVSERNIVLRWIVYIVLICIICACFYFDIEGIGYANF